MPKNIFQHPFDLTSPDGVIQKIHLIDERNAEATVIFENISSHFRGFYIDLNLTSFVIKSTFAQLGVDGVASEICLAPEFKRAEAKITFQAFNQVGVELLRCFSKGLHVGKLFAADPTRRVHTMEYIKRLLNKSDPEGNPLLIFGEKYKTEEYIEDEENQRLIVKVPLLPGHWVYDESIHGFIPTVTRGLKKPDSSFRKFLFLHQIHRQEPRKIPKSGILFVRTATMNIRTLFARVVPELLPPGFRHASADLIEPQRETGDIFEFHGESEEEITHVPFEFYTLEPFREHFFFADRNLLQSALANSATLFEAFETAPQQRAASFIVKGKQLMNLSQNDWIISGPPEDELLVIPPRTRKEEATLKSYVEAQAAYVIAHAMEEEQITSQGIMLCNYLPPPLLKNILLGERVTRCLKAIYFRTPSQKHGEYFSHNDRSMLYDLARASVDVYWVDFSYNLILKYVLREGRDFGMFVPINKEDDFTHATFFGIYGSRLKGSDIEDEIEQLFRGLIEMKENLDHEKLNRETPIAIATGGGPGIMSMGNKIASDLGLLSVGHAVDFTKPHETELVEEAMNPYIQAKMTYHLEHLFVRQSEFALDFPMFFEGGIGTDFEFLLELLRTQVGIKPPAPILLFGHPDYWREKITCPYQTNLKHGTIRGSEWVSNNFFCVQNHQQALEVYYRFFTNRLPIGVNAPPTKEGFVIFEEES